MLRHYHFNWLTNRKKAPLIVSGGASAQSQASSLRSLCSIIVYFEEEKSFCRVALWLHPGCYKKATPALTSARTELWEVLHLVGPPVCLPGVCTSNWGGWLFRCDGQELKKAFHSQKACTSLQCCEEVGSWTSAETKQAASVVLHLNNTWEVLRKPSVHWRTDTSEEQSSRKVDRRPTLGFHPGRVQSSGVLS